MSFGAFYRMLRELPPSVRPEERLLADDEALDQWYEHFQREQARASVGKQQGTYDILKGPRSADAIPQWRPES